ncbi:uncharacterized protein [Prorops nasuta]|uniref:uncharacterized protein n=1 Tax=Prorops nasuta TaxID=863751 RepID=UPI0034CF2201
MNIIKDREEILPIIFKNNCDCEVDSISKNINENEDYDIANILLEFYDQELQEHKNPQEARIKEFVSSKIQKENNINLMQLLKSDEHLKTFTGITFTLLNNLKEILTLCENNSNKFGCNIETRIVLCLCKLKLNFTFKCLSVLFCMTRQTCSSLFVTTLQSLAYVLEKAIYWPTKEDILKSMPKCFKKFQETYVVLDCTEIPVEKPKCLKCNLRLYSHYKGCETIKFLVGVAPSGLIIFISEPFGGRASDKAIFNYSKIIERLEPTRDAIMVDKGFAIEEDCALAHIKLFIPPKLGKNKQLPKEHVTSTVEIASSRVHVERSIQRIKLFNILKAKMSLKTVPYIGEIIKVICGIVNLSESILSDDKF